jgi:hypothetical protein
MANLDFIDLWPIYHFKYEQDLIDMLNHTAKIKASKWLKSCVFLYAICTPQSLQWYANKMLEWNRSGIKENDPILRFKGPTNN